MLMNFFFLLLISALFLCSCQTISEKVDNASQQEEKKLSKFLKKTESELKIEFGKPDLIEKANNQNKVLVYYNSKLKIKCERRFEINKKNKIVGFSSKNCF